MRFRAVRRGFKEADLIFGSFADEFLAGLDEKGLDDFEALLEQPDQEVFAWLKGSLPVPLEFATDVFVRLKSICGRTNPKWSS